MDNLTEAQIIEAQVQEIIDEAEQLNEFLPLIPLAIWAGGAAWTAYDVYRTAKQYKAGEITKGEVAKRVGTDVALSIAGGAIAKGLIKGGKVGYGVIKKVVDKSKEKFDVVDRANKRGRTTKDITIGGQKIVDPTKVTTARGADGKMRALTKAEKKALARASDTRSTAAKAIDAVSTPVKAVTGLGKGGLDKKMGTATSNVVKKITDPLMKKKNIPTVAIDPLTKKFKKLDGPIDDRTRLAKVIDAPKAGLDALRKVDDFIGDIPGNIAKKTIDTVTQNPIAKAEKARRKAAKQIRAADAVAARAAKEIDKQMQQAKDLRKRDATQRIRSADADAAAAAKKAAKSADEFKRNAAQRNASAAMRNADNIAVKQATRQAADQKANAAKRSASAAIRKADKIATDRASDVAAFKRNAAQRTASTRMRSADKIATRRADDLAVNDKRRAAAATIRKADSDAIKKAKEIEIAAKKKRADAVAARAARKAEAEARIKKADAAAAKRLGKKTDAGEIAARVAARRAARKVDGKTKMAKRVGRRVDKLIPGGKSGGGAPAASWQSFSPVAVNDPLNLSRANKG